MNLSNHVFILRGLRYIIVTLIDETDDEVYDEVAITTAVFLGTLKNPPFSYQHHVTENFQW